MLSDIPNWFTNSDVRRDAFKRIFNVMNTTDDVRNPVRSAPLPFVKTCATRWLVRGKVMYNILVNWEELKAYFVAAEKVPNRLDTRFRCRMIKDMLFEGYN